MWRPALLGLLVQAGALAQSLPCGDCTGDNQIDILDALTAAQHGAQIIVLTGDDLRRCDVVPPPGVDIIDALLLAQYSAALPVTPSCTPAVLDWHLRTPATSPSPRSYSAMVYDAARAVTLLFGGIDAGQQLLGDTWEWNGTTWTQRFPAQSPPARGGHGMAYDANRSLVVLYGGFNGGAFHEDTWEWDGTTWTRRSPVNFPLGRGDFSIGYDPARGVTTIFGGTTMFFVPLVDDTYEWDGNDWAHPAPATRPDRRAGHAMVYDGARVNTVLFGGYTDMAQTADTWIWDGSNWTVQAPATSPPQREGHAMVWDAGRALALLFGGEERIGPAILRLDDTWEWDGTDWAALTTQTTPPPRRDPGMAYDPVRGVTVLFGGSDGAPLADTWELGP